MMKSTIKRFRPESVVSFFTEEGELVARSKPKDQGDAINGDIISIATTNDLSADAGTFQLNLTARKRWDKSLASNDLVIIRMRRNKEDEKASTVFFGLIDDVRKSTSIQQNSAQRSVAVTGRNFAKALINFEVGVVQEVEMTSASMGWLQGRVTFTGESSGKIVEGILKELVFKYMKYKFNSGKTLEDLLKTKLESREGEKLLDEKSFVNFQGSMLAFIKEVTDAPFNQFFFETYNGDPTLVVRATPFNKDKWDKLTLHEVSDEDIVSDDTGRSDLETYSLYSVGVQQIAGGFDTSKSTGVVPLWNDKYFEKYGLKRLHRFTAYVGFAGGGDSADTSESLKKYQEDLYNWNILNPRFYNGMLVVRGENKYKIGDRILRKSVEDGRDIEFFIEGVSHEFVNFSHWITKLSVTRGVDEKGAGRFKEPWGTGKDYEAGALGTAAGGTLNGGGGTGGGGTSTGGTGSGGGLLPPGTGGSVKGIQIVNTALSWKSKPNRYVFGGGRTTTDISRGVFDCSSWIRYVYEQCGINAGPLSGTTTDTLAKLGQPVPSVMNLQLGDLVMFNTYKHNGHVTIYIGNGKCIGTQTNQGVAEIDMQWWINKYGLGSMRRLI